MYRAPVDEICHTLKQVTGLGQAMADDQAGELSEDLLNAIMEEAGKFLPSNTGTSPKVLPGP